MENKKGILKPFYFGADFEEITGGLKRNQSPVSVTGVSDSVRAHLIFCACKALNKNALVVAANQTKAKAIFEDLNFFFEGKVSDVVLLAMTDDEYFEIIEETECESNGTQENSQL